VGGMCLRPDRRIITLRVRNQHVTSRAPMNSSRTAAEFIGKIQRKIVYVFPVGWRVYTRSPPRYDNALGARTGEWESTSPGPDQAAGQLILLINCSTLSASSRFLSPPPPPSSSIRPNTILSPRLSWPTFSNGVSCLLPRTRREILSDLLPFCRRVS
jgi:hypothetical protein